MDLAGTVRHKGKQKKTKRGTAKVDKLDEQEAKKVVLAQWVVQVAKNPEDRTLV